MLNSQRFYHGKASVLEFPSYFACKSIHSSVDVRRSFLDFDFNHSWSLTGLQHWLHLGAGASHCSSVLYLQLLATRNCKFVLCWFILVDIVLLGLFGYLSSLGSIMMWSILPRRSTKHSWSHMAAEATWNSFLFLPWMLRTGGAFRVAGPKKRKLQFRRGMPDIFDFFRGACKFVWKVGCQLECQGWSWQVLCKFCVEVGCQIKCQGSSWQVRCIFRKNQHLEVEILINCGVSKCLLHFFESCF